MATSETGQPEIAAAAERVGRYRWVICALLFAATAINYVDRQMIGVLEPDYLRPEFHSTAGEYANLVFYFQLPYPIGYLRFDKVVDCIRARSGSTPVMSRKASTNAPATITPAPASSRVRAPA